MSTHLAKGKAKIGLVLPEALIERIRLRAVRQKMRPSAAAEELLYLGLKALKGAKTEPETVHAS